MNPSAVLKAEGALKWGVEGGLVSLCTWKGSKEDLIVWRVQSSLSDLLLEGSLGGLAEVEGLKAAATSAPQQPSSCS